MKRKSILIGLVLVSLFSQSCTNLKVTGRGPLGSVEASENGLTVRPRCNNGN